MVQATMQPETTFRYVFPIKDAKVSYGRDHHTYPATDIFVAEGSQFVAVTDGVVFHVTSEDLWSAANDDPALRSGLSVSILGDDGVRYHGSHLSSIADGIEPGVRVSAGQLLGLTGKSGNAQNTPPHLHFGIARPTTPDDWKVRRGEMNPYEFLKSWQQGIPLQPVFGNMP
jgi:murein DD-endopeptidase MepM/ murein hydrolase activator NlpD